MKKELKQTYFAIGGVLGDIGTSPLYVMALIFTVISPTLFNVLGVLSLIFWSFIFLTLKYVIIAVNLDNNGEGGTFALLNLIKKASKISQIKNVKLLFIATFLSMLCGALLLSDGVITPAISVLSAVEGIEVKYPLLKFYILPVSCGILTMLFLYQKRGTEKIAKTFSPIIIIWFITIGFLGFMSLKNNFLLLKAINPYYAVKFIIHYPFSLIIVIFSYVVLAITGGEALYADVSHYGKFAIRGSWLAASICLLLNYFGQGEYLLTHKNTINPFFALSLNYPHFVYIFLLIIATLAAIIASQAMITGSFSTYKQAMELRMFPRVKVLNTSHKNIGQIYIPIVNKGMFIATILTIFIFKKSVNLGNAYGLAVTGAFIGTTLMMGIFFFIKYYANITKFILISPLLLFFAYFDTTFFFSNLTKIPKGGWYPLLICAFLLITMYAWQLGSKLIYKNIPKCDIQKFKEILHKNKYFLLNGSDIFMSGDENNIPASLLEQEKLGVLKRKTVILTVKNSENPWGINIDTKLISKIKENGEGEIHQVIIEKGYMRVIVNIPKILEELNLLKEPYRFIFGFWDPIIGNTKKFKKVILKYFIFIYKTAANFNIRFSIPPSKIKYSGGQIEIK